ATRLAGVALAWNVFQHFYPYFDVVKTDWPRALEVALTSAATDADEKAFLRTLRLLVAKLYDGHGNVFHPSDSGYFTIPALWEVVEGRLVITHVAAEGAGGLQPGDVVLKVNGKDALAALSEEETLISGATPQWRRYTALYRLRMGMKDSEVNLDAQSQDGKRMTVALKRSMELRALEQPRPEKIQELKQGIFYLDIGRLKDEEFQAALPRLEQAKGIIFDLRGYPSVSPLVISHLIDKPVQSARWNVPLITVPDHKGMTNFATDGRWELAPIAPRLKARIAFLTDGRAISYAESYMGIIEAYKLAEIVGETTAGTNGNINPFILPGRYNVIWTGMKVLKHDGSQHHGVGIKPTVPASRTIRGVAEKRDEQLERAIAVVSQ
ncbi:MAG: peptidase S41, partial [Pyrinomonadaceae bacterium]|nr:peptidase S41 [Pyrinomonadaceae bacterium]